MPPHRRDTGMVFQNYAVLPHMTVFENVAFGCATGRARAQIRERVGGPGLARLSGFESAAGPALGRPAAAGGPGRAMVIEPRVLLMDEPLSNLDAKLRVEMRTEIRDLQRELGITTLYVTHDQEEALVISDRIAVMKPGLVQQRPAVGDLPQPGNAFVASFVGAMNFVAADAAMPEGRSPPSASARAAGRSRPSPSARRPCIGRRGPPWPTAPPVCGCPARCARPPTRGRW